MYYVRVKFVRFNTKVSRSRCVCICLLTDNNTPTQCRGISVIYVLTKFHMSSSYGLYVMKTKAECITMHHFKTIN
jgi:hypothetical protein